MSPRIHTQATSHQATPAPVPPQKPVAVPEAHSEEPPVTGTAPAESVQIAQLPGQAEAPTVDLHLDEKSAPAKAASAPTPNQPPAHPATVSSYGPGLYGNKTANGIRLTPNTVGVAHKTLPLGTKVEIIVNGKTVPAKVIDRGPYVHGRDFDLTTGLIKKLGFHNCDAFGVRNVLVRIFK